MGYKGLKCPQCRQHTAYKEWGFNGKLGRRYVQKLCGCGYKGQRKYYGRIMTEADYQREMEEMHRRVEERLKKDAP